MSTSTYAYNPASVTVTEVSKSKITMDETLGISFSQYAKDEPWSISVTVTPTLARELLKRLQEVLNAPDPA